jgi:hypothetical protein
MHGAYFDLPICVLVAQLIPVNVETSMMAILSGLTTFYTQVYGRVLGATINIAPNVTAFDYSNLWVLMSVQLALSFLPLFFVGMLPTDDDVKKVKA